MIIFQNIKDINTHNLITLREKIDDELAARRPTFNKYQRAQIKGLTDAGFYISAIKLIREFQDNMSLYDAKQLMESIRDNTDLVEQTSSTDSTDFD